MSYNPFQTILDESHLKPGTKLKNGDEELKAVKPVGDDKYLVKEEERDIKEDVAKTVSNHRVSVTVSDPNHTLVTRRKEQLQKYIRVSADSASDAATKAKAYYKKLGYKVHDAAHAGMVREEVSNESTVVRTQNGRKMVSAEVAIRLAREIAARRKEGEKATTTDLKHATKALTREETEQIDELSSNTLKSYADKRMERVKNRYAELRAKQNLE